MTLTMTIREAYCPAHFGNSYETMWPLEMADYLAEMKWWGFNRYSDWINTTDVCNPYGSDAYWNLAMELLDRKKRNFRTAQKLGLGLNLVVTPNHVYLDQLRPEFAAEKGERIIGQLICPSKPEARRIILGNFEHRLRDLAESGIRLSAITAFAYDYGGCACESCRPWILTYARLVTEIHEIAEEHHPGIEPWVCSWWWTPVEYDLFNDWAAREAPGWLKAMTFHIAYDRTRFKDVVVPDGCRKTAFPHIGYGDRRAVGDIYGKLGPVVAPTRLQKTLDDIAAQGATGFQAYSEGVFDDCNKAVLAGVASGKFANARDALAAYAKRYFDADEQQAESWAEWFAGWSDSAGLDMAKATAAFEHLTGDARSSWRLEHWRSRLALETLDRRIGMPAEGEWTREKLELVERFWTEQENLNRHIYKLGPRRHVFANKSSPREWYDSWKTAMEGLSDSEEMDAEA